MPNRIQHALTTDVATFSQLGFNMVTTTPRTIAVANQKGGVGKTTTVMNLGAALAERGAQVLIIDIDPQSNSTSGLGIDPARARLTVYHLLSGEAEIDEVATKTSVAGLYVVPSQVALAGASYRGSGIPACIASGRRAAASVVA